MQFSVCITHWSMESFIGDTGISKSHPVPASNIWGDTIDPMAIAIARAYNGGLGENPQQGTAAKPLVRG